MRSRLKTWILKALIRRVNLDVLLKEDVEPETCSLWDRILLSKFSFRIFSKELADLEWSVNSLPYVGGADVFGRVDNVETMENGAIFLRGWLFSPFAKIRSLSIILEGTEFPILAFHLQRHDVYEHFFFLENSMYCGFVAVVHGCSLPQGSMDVRFLASTERGGVLGSFGSFQFL